MQAYGSAPATRQAATAPGAGPALGTRLPTSPAATAQRPSPSPQPVVRGQAPDDPAPPKNALRDSTPLIMPSPEELGLTAPKQPAADLDWQQIHNRLQQQGAVCSQRLPLQDGGYRFVVILSTTQKDRVQHIEAEGPTEAAAVRAALDKVGELRP